MKILIYGPGVLGSILAAKLIHANQEVTLLARGRRLSDLRKDGLVLQHFLTGERLTIPPAISTGKNFGLTFDVKSRLEPNDIYDLVIVCMGAQQVGAVLPRLAKNKFTPNVLFLGNNIAGPDALVAALGKERVLRGFYAAGGKLDGPVVHYADGTQSRKGHLTMGEVDGATSLRLEWIGSLFQSAGIPVDLCPEIDAWLKTHASLIVAIAGALYLAGGDNVALSQNRPAVTLALMAMREALLALRVNKIPVIPAGARMYEWIPEKVLVPLAQRFVGSEMVGYAFSHADKARPEMRLLICDLITLAKEARVPVPALEKLAEFI